MSEYSECGMAAIRAIKRMEVPADKYPPSHRSCKRPSLKAPGKRNKVGKAKQVFLSVLLSCKKGRLEGKDELVINEKQVASLKVPLV